MFRKTSKIVAALLLIIIINTPHITFASDSEGFRFLFPPSDKFEYVERKLTDKYYIVFVGGGDSDGTKNICDTAGRLLSDINFEHVTMTQGSKLYVLLKSGNLAIIDLETRAAKKLGYDTYSNLDTVYDGKTIPVLKDGKTSMADPDGNIVIEPDVYSTMYAMDHLDGFLVAIDHGSYQYTYGVINKVGKEVIPAVYEDLYISADGEAIFRDKNGKMGVLNTVTGDIILPAATYDFICNTDDYGVDMVSAWAFINGKLYQRIERGSKIGLIDNRLNIVIPTEYDKLSVFENGAVIAQKGGKFGVFMLGGKEILPFEYDAVSIISYYESFGLDGRTGRYAASDSFAVKMGDLYALYDINGAELLPFAYTGIWGLGNPRLIYLTDADGKKGLASTDGRLLTPKFFDNIDFLYNDAAWIGTDGQSYTLYNSDNGIMYLAKDKRQYTVYGIDGSVIGKIAGEYDNITHVNPKTKMAFVTNGDKSGVVDFDGNRIIPIGYTDLDGNALVKLPPVLGLNVSLGKKGGKWGVVDSEGRILVPFTLGERTAENWHHDMLVISDVTPYLNYSGEGLLTGISYDNGNNKNEFILNGSYGSEYWGSYLGKGAVLIVE